jgi:pyruvate kinase
VAICLSPALLDELIAQLSVLREQMRLHESRHAVELAPVAPEYQPSARNLLHYLALRQHDVRALQRRLSELGLSSLGRSEAHALASVDAVLAALHRMAGRPLPATLDSLPPVDFASGPERLRRNADLLLGTSPPPRDVRIMVTMPSEAAERFDLVRELVTAGMDVMRINAAHDDPDAWRAMVGHLEQARRERGRAVRIQFDLAGPKLRTGELAESCRLVRWRVTRDVRGRTRAPARIWLVPSDAPAVPCPASADAVLTVDGNLLARSRAGDALRLRDTRGRRREITVVGAADGGRWGECERGAFVETGTRVRLVRGTRTLGEGGVGDLPPVTEPLWLRAGDRLRVRAPGGSGLAAHPAHEGDEPLPAEIPCTLPEVFADLRVGERMLFDDGKLASRIVRVDRDGALVEITRTPPGGGRLRADKGINLPDSDLSLPALTDADLGNLDFAVAHADLIGQSFVRRPEDVRALHEQLEQRGGSRLGVLLKIETRVAFDALPRILLAALGSPPIGVMVARGDLAVEVGYERLAEVQEEVLWLCEAAHVPVVWATQVLETLARKGQASRAEVTDAVMGGRAECVMLNKGPYVVEAVRFLDDVLHRMKLHQEKKRSMLRRLSIASLTGRFSRPGALPDGPGPEALRPGEGS